MAGTISKTELPPKTKLKIFLGIQNYLLPKKVKDTMSHIHSKINQHANTQEIIIHDEEKKINQDPPRTDTDIKLNKDMRSYCICFIYSLYLQF